MASQSHNPLDSTPPAQTYAPEDGYFCKDPNCTKCEEMGRRKGKVEAKALEVCKCPIIGFGILHEAGCIDNLSKGA